MTQEPMEYVISLQRPSYKLVDIVSQLLLVIFLAAFAFYMIQSGRYASGWLYLVPAILVGLWIWGYVQSARPDFLVYYRVELMIAAMGWIILPLAPYAKLIGAGYALMSIVERYVKMPDEIIFSEEKVVRRTFPPKKYEWVDIDNVIIRDNLFTLDLRNNQVIQKTLEEPVSKELEEEFNSWCRKHLHFQAEA